MSDFRNVRALIVHSVQPPVHSMHSTGKVIVIKRLTEECTCTHMVHNPPECKVHPPSYRRVHCTGSQGRQMEA